MAQQSSGETVKPDGYEILCLISLLCVVVVFWRSFRWKVSCFGLFFCIRAEPPKKI